jgi:inner membrane protein YhjD
MVWGISAVQRGVETGRERATDKVRGARRRWRWFDHVGRAYDRYQEQRGDRLAAALTYYGLLSFFPLVALAFALVGYAVTISPHASKYVSDAISNLLPGLASQLPVSQIAEAKAGVGIIGLVVLMWAGLGWIGVWRESLRTIWKIDPGGGGNFFVKKLWDLVVLFSLGTVLLASVLVSSLATSATHVALRWVGLADVTGAGTVLRLASLAVALAADMLVFLVLFSRLSGTRAPWRRLLKGALFGAVGLEILKLAGTYLIARTTKNPVYASFAVIVGLVVWINLVSRFTLFAASWTATRRVILRADEEAIAAEAEIEADESKEAEAEAEKPTPTPVSNDSERATTP